MSSEPPSFPVSERLWGVFGDEIELKVAEHAVAAGLISAAELQAAIEDSERENGRSLGAALIASGAIDRRSLQALAERLAHEGNDPAPIAADRLATAPAEAREAAMDPTRQLGHFVLVALLGRGGTSDVWKAWDRVLSRWVAIKVSIAALESANARERFEREATAVARLSHPNIVPIHLTGADRGRPYIVMPFIDGQTLDRMKLTPERALQITGTAALALQHAHAHGVVHRDVKPSNIMIDHDGGVFVLDFGLVHLLEENAVGLTRPGDVLGTAGFMSPEQARGGSEARLASTDVYGLGATLYHLVTGKPPFAGESLPAIVARIAEGYPTPPRRLNPDLDVRIEIVIGKAMEKNPHRRYRSMQAFADDIKRLLGEEDIAARPARWHRKLVLAMRRHRTLSVTAAALAVLAVVLGGARLRIDREQALASAAVRDLARSTLDTALRLRRAGDLVGMRQALPQLTRAYEQMHGRASDMAEVEYLMGRMHRALMNEKQALAHQDKALIANPDFAPALYERAILLSKQYGRQLDRAQSSARRREGGGNEDATTAAPVVEAGRPDLAPLRESILRDCARIESRGLAGVDAEAARGVVAHYRQRYPEARERLAKVVALDPLKEEAWELLARTAEQEILNPAIAPGESERLLLLAEAAYSKGLALDKGYLPHLAGRCTLRQQLGYWSEAHPGHLPATLSGYRGQALQDAAAAVAMDPDHGPARVCRARILGIQASDEFLHGRDPRALFDAALIDFDAALRMDPELADVLSQRGATRRGRGNFAAETGHDPLPDLAASERDLDRAIGLDPAAAAYWRSRGRTRTRRGMFFSLRGRDPGGELSAAIADLTESIRLDPRRSYSWEWRADAISYRGLDRLDHGDTRAAEQDFDLAEQDFARALELFREENWMYVSRGNLRLWRGRARVAEAGDPLPDWKNAEDDFARALPIDMTVAPPWFDRAVVRIERATYLRGRGKEFRHDLQAAARDIDQAIAIDPDNAEAWAARGDLERARGQYRSALTTYRKALDFNPMLDRWLAKRMADVETPR